MSELSNFDDVRRSQTFSFGYDGEAVRDHAMNVRDLAPALVGMADLVDAINEVVNPNGTEVQTSVRATAEGSIIVQLAIEVSVGEALTQFLTGGGDPKVALDNIATVLGIATPVGGGVLWLLRKLKGRDPADLDSAIRGRIAEIKLPGGEVIEVPRSVHETVQNRRARAAAHAVVRPLEEPGIDELRLYDGDGVQADPVEIVTKDDVPSFTVEPEPVRELEVEEQETMVQVVSPQFDRKYKWRLTRGGSVFYAEMLDKEFLSQVEHRHIQFGAGDLLYVVLQNRPRLQGARLLADYSVLRVIDHIPNGGQSNLELE